MRASAHASRTSAGFSLTELLGAVALVALSGLVAGPSFLGDPARQRRATYAGNLRQLGLALSLDANENRDESPPLAA